MIDKLFNLTYVNGLPDLCNPMGREVALIYIPQVNEAALFALEVGQTLVDKDGDTWERVA